VDVVQELHEPGTVRRKDGLLLRPRQIASGLPHGVVIDGGGDVASEVSPTQPLPVSLELSLARRAGQHFLRELRVVLHLVHEVLLVLLHAHALLFCEFVEHCVPELRDGLSRAPLHDQKALRDERDLGLLQDGGVVGIVLVIRLRELEVRESARDLQEKERKKEQEKEREIEEKK